jgi:hypothetical protein
MGRTAHLSERGQAGLQPVALGLRTCRRCDARNSSPQSARAIRVVARDSTGGRKPAAVPARPERVAGGDHPLEAGGRAGTGVDDRAEHREPCASTAHSRRAPRAERLRRARLPAAGRQTRPLPSPRTPARAAVGTRARAVRRAARPRAHWLATPRHRSRRQRLLWLDWSGARVTSVDLTLVGDYDEPAPPRPATPHGDKDARRPMGRPVRRARRGARGDAAASPLPRSRRAALRLPKTAGANIRLVTRASPPREGPSHRQTHTSRRSTRQFLGRRSNRTPPGNSLAMRDGLK